MARHQYNPDEPTKKEILGAISAHNAGKEFPVYNENYNREYKLGTHSARTLVEAAARFKHGIVGKPGRVSKEDVHHYLLWRGRPGLTQGNPKYGIGRKIPFTGRIRGREFEARDIEHAKKKAQRLAQQTGKDYYVWDQPEKNPATAGVEAIPAKWTSATISTRGGQVQIRTGGRR